MPVKDHKTIAEQHAEERRRNASCPNCYKDGVEVPDQGSKRICADRACPVVTFDWMKADNRETTDNDDQPCGCENPDYSTAFTDEPVCLSCGWKGTPE